MKFRIGLDMGTLVGSGVLLSVGNTAWKLKPTYQPSDLTSLSRTQVWAPERWVTQCWSPSVGYGTDVLVGLSAVAPLSTLFISKQAKKEWFVLLVIYGETFLLTTSTMQFTKGFVDRTRPFVYHTSAPNGLKLETDARASFFSGHSALTASFCMLTWQLLDTYHAPRHKDLLKWVKVAAFTIPALTGAGRIIAGKHYPSDVLIGLGVGGVIGYFIPQLHKIQTKTHIQTQIYPIPSGLGLCLTW